MSQADHSPRSAAPRRRRSAEPRVEGGMQLISRVAAVLRALEGQQAGLSLGQIASATGLPRATVQRIVDGLVVEQLLAPDPVNGGVGLGAALIRIAGSAHSDFKAKARPHLESLCRQARETVVLTAHRHGRLVFVDQILPDRPLQIVLNPAAEIDPWFTATGKAHLAAMPPEELGSWLPARLDPPTAHSVPTVAALKRQLEAIRRDGVAYDREERTDGSCALAAWVRDADGTVYVVTLVTTSSRFARRADEFRQKLLAAQAAIVRSLGGCADG